MASTPSSWPLQHNPVLDTPRLRLRLVGPDDADWIAAYANDPDVSRMVAHIPHPYDRELAVEFLTFLDSQTRPPAHLAFAIEEKPAQTPVGLIGADNITQASAEIGYWLGKSFWGQGFATEALRAMLAFAFDTLRLRTVTAGHFIDNDASARVLLKAGFSYTGAQRWQQCLARREDVRRKNMILTATAFRRA